MSFFPKGWGEYPPEYNREVHGPYNPSVYYGKRDTPFFQVKLGEFGAWFGRRNKSPRALTQALSRAFWKHQLEWCHVKKPGGAGLFQYVFFASFIMYLMDYQRFKLQRHYKYH